jgi:hypothetical protein
MARAYRTMYVGARAEARSRRLRVRAGNARGSALALTEPATPFFEAYCSNRRDMTRRQGDRLVARAAKACSSMRRVLIRTGVCPERVGSQLGLNQRVRAVFRLSGSSCPGDVAVESDLLRHDMFISTTLTWAQSSTAIASTSIR